MNIDDNPVEVEAMAAFRRGDGNTGHRLQDSFLEDFHESVRRREDFCPCTSDCRHHGHCVDCVTLHRGHGDHLPFCLHGMLNRRLEKLSELSEHSMRRAVRADDTELSRGHHSIETVNFNDLDDEEKEAVLAGEADYENGGTIALEEK